tara:strand:- start:130834 stop:131394 length:561 start_codon:yes stop_codon:yes gene_type:complete
MNLNELVYLSLSERFTIEQITEYLNYQKKWEFVGYIILPLILLLKISIISIILDAGCFFFGKEIIYKKIFKIVTKAEFIFLLTIVFKTVWFYFFQQSYTLEDLQYFYPLSFLNIFDYQSLESWFIYPLQTINLFEIAYWIFLAHLLDKELLLHTEEHLGIKIVSSSYGVALLIWVVGIMFFTLNMS